MLPNVPVPLDLILLLLMKPPIHDAARHRHAVSPQRRQAPPALGPPPQFSTIRKDNARRRSVRRRAALRAQARDERDDAALGDTACAADDAVREHAELLGGLAEEEDHARGGLEVGGDKDGDMREGGGCAEREGDREEVVRGGEAGVDESGDGFCGGRLAVLRIG